MGGFTRLLHTGAPDGFMAEIPTVVADPLPPELERVAAGYVVLNRPYAFQQWAVQHLPALRERYVLMSEPDHLFLLPPPLWATRAKPAAFPFFYIEPAAEANAEILKRYNPAGVPLERFAPVGNSPVMIAKEALAPLLPLWANLSIAVKRDTDADRAWGWVQEMYAFSIAAATVAPPVGPLEFELRPEFMLQPPWDAALTDAKSGLPAMILHFTYGNDFSAAGEFTPGKIGAWHWDKRDYTEKYPPGDTPQPPPGCTNAAVRRLIAAVNEAAAALPGWSERAFKTWRDVRPVFGGDEGDDAAEQAEGGEEEGGEERAADEAAEPGDDPEEAGLEEDWQEAEQVEDEDARR
jgi:hypothetical protein